MSTTLLLGDKYYQSEGRNSSYIRGAIKNFSAWPSSIRNKIKIVFASYSSKARNTTCTIWLLGYKYFVRFSGRQLLAYDMEKRSVLEWQFWPFCSFHCMLCCSESELKWWIQRFIPNNELWNECLLGHASIVQEVFKKLVYTLVLAFLTPIWQTLCLYTKMRIL